MVGVYIFVSARSPHKMVSRAAFGPWAVVCPALDYTPKRMKLKLETHTVFLLQLVFLALKNLS